MSIRRDLLAQPFPKEWESWLSESMACYGRLSSAEQARLRNDAWVLTAEKSWEGCDGLKVTELMKLTVAAQAALLLLGLEHDYFSRVLSIVLFPTEFELPAESWEEHGTVVSGQAVDYGTVYLSWASVLSEAREPTAGHNLVIHEFAHQLDFLDGYTNGAPPLRSRDLTRRWQEVMHGAFNRLRRDLQKGRKTFLGSYAATNPTEFFSVASEKFFSLPAQLRRWHPEVFGILAEYYRVDPLGWFERTAGVNLAPAVPRAEAVEVQATESGDVVESGFIDFKCPYCQNPVSFPHPSAGTLKQCPNCLESMFVPEGAGRQAERIPFPIRTERLVLRPFQTLDAKDLAELLSDPESLRYVDWNDMGLEDTEEWITSQSGLRFPRTEEEGYLAIEAVQARRVIGLVAFWFLDKACDLGQFEVIIQPNWQRKGYGIETVHGLFGYAFDGLRVRRLVADCDSQNRAARGLLLKAGMRQESEWIQNHFRKGEWVNTLGFALLKSEYESRDRQRHGPGMES